MLRHTFKQQNILKYSFTVCIKTNMMPSSGERVYKMVLSHFDSHIAFKISLPWIHSQVTHWTLLHSLVSVIFVDILLMTQPALSELTMNNSEDKMNRKLSKLEENFCHDIFVLHHPYKTFWIWTSFFQSLNMTNKKWHSTTFRSKNKEPSTEQKNKIIQYPEGPINECRNDRNWSLQQPEKVSKSINTIETKCYIFHHK